MATAVEAFLDALPPESRELVLALRDVVRRTAPHAEESLLWGGLSYHRPEVGGRVKGAVCQVVVKGGRVRLDFIHGVSTKDGGGLTGLLLARGAVDGAGGQVLGIVRGSFSTATPTTGAGSVFRV
jgi:hypothetical protein